MKWEILRKLKEIEKKNDVKIIFAVESGSRMWNFASRTSDYDIRFLYLSKLKHYLSVTTQKDYITLVDEEKKLDFSGWDVQKACGLLVKSNMSLYEWVNSPIVYLMTEEMDDFIKASQYCWDKKRLIYSYIHLASGNYKAYVKDKEETKLKKYLYILRTIAACMWLEKNFVGKDLKNRGTESEEQKNVLIACPLSIESLSGVIKDDNEYIYNFMQKVIKVKKEGEDVSLVKPDAEANKWIEEKIAYYKAMDKDLKTSKSKYKRTKNRTEKFLDSFFYEMIQKQLKAEEKAAAEAKALGENIVKTEEFDDEETEDVNEVQEIKESGKKEKTAKKRGRKAKKTEE